MGGRRGPRRSSGSRKRIKGKWGVERRELYSPKTRHHAAKQEHAVALDEGGEEGEEAVDRHGYQEALLAAHLV